MAAVRVRHSSSSESAPPIDPRKRRRMESNRESARRSRERKRQHMEDLIRDSSRLGSENDAIRRRIEEVAQRCQGVESENVVLRGQLAELTARLENLNSVLRMVQDVSGIPMDIPEIPDPLLEPWRLPCPAQAVLASHSRLRC